ncbi:class F sortase [Kribbella sancticallisti]|uniref:Class F sortase n=1 Tax=Kribbella sancticallisti TaxID=460087 RepID=A0ABN2CCN8_9ACTN
MVLVVSLVALVAVPIFWYGREAGEQPASVPEPAQTVPTRSTATPPTTPSATAPSVKTRAADLPTVAAEAQPLELIVGKAQLRMPVVPTGVAADGQMELPPNPARIGWYRFGPGPASTTGSVVLGGHLDSREYGVGPLARLSRTRPGDPIELRLSDGRTLQYRTEAVRDVDKQTLALAVVFDRSGLRRLQIVTCGGEYLPDRGGYQENLVVTAVPVE